MKQHLQEKKKRGWLEQIQSDMQFFSLWFIIKNYVQVYVIWRIRRNMRLFLGRIGLIKKKRMGTTCSTLTPTTIQDNATYYY